MPRAARPCGRSGRTRRCGWTVSSTTGSTRPSPPSKASCSSSRSRARRRRSAPRRGSSSTDENVYVAARLWTSVPESDWIANEMQRDSFQIINNDYFSVGIDTFYDRRNGFAFMITPIGGFFDYEITDEGNPNNDWNPIWNSSTGRFDGGWTVEMEIPFKSLRFQPGPEPGLGPAARTPHPLQKRDHLSDDRPHLGRPRHVPPVGRRHPGRRRGPERQPPVRDQAVRHRLGQHGHARRRADPQRGRRRRRHRRQVRPDAEPDRRLHLQHRLRAGGGRRGAAQPVAVQPVLSGEAGVLPRRPRHLRLRPRGRQRGRPVPRLASRRVGLFRRRRRTDRLLQPPHRPERRRDRADSRRGAADRQGPAATPSARSTSRPTRRPGGRSAPTSPPSG